MRLFDTTFIVDLVSDDKGAAELAMRIDEEKSFKAISAVTVYEYLLGVHYLYSDSKQFREKLDTANKHLAPFEVLPLTNEIARECSQLQASLKHKGRLLGVNDLYIAATALSLKLSLVTRNIDDFKKVPNLNIENY